MQYPTSPLDKDKMQAHIIALGHTVAPYDSDIARTMNCSLEGDNSGISSLVSILQDKKQHTIGEVTTTFLNEVGFIHSDRHSESTETFFELVRWIVDESSDDRLKQIEYKEFKKAGPYVSASSSEISQKFLAYFGKDFEATQETEDKLTNAAIKIGKGLCQVMGSRQDILPVDLALSLITKGTHFGAPYFTSKWGQNYDRANPDVFMKELGDVSERWANGEVEIRDYLKRLPSTLFSRTVPDGRSILEARKKRVVFAPSKFEAVIGKRISSVVIDAFQRSDFSLGYAGNAIVEPYLQRAVAESDHVLSLDYSGFDQCAKRKAREYVGIALKQMFDEKWHSYIDAMVDLHHNPNVNTPFGMVIINPDSDNTLGLQSGLGLTGVYGTLWNRILASVMVSDMRAQWNVSNVKHFCYGDDTLMGWRGDWIDPLYFEDYLGQFGMQANSDKQEYASGTSRYGVLCQKYFFFHPTGSDVRSPHDTFDRGIVTKGIHSLCRMMPRLVYKDITSDSESEVIMEAKQTATNNGKQIIEVISSLEELKNHPGFQMLVGAVMEVHPLHLMTREVVNHVARKNRISDKCSLTPGIESFETVKQILTWEDSVGLTDLYLTKNMTSSEIDLITDKMMRWQDRYVRRFLTHPTREQIVGRLDGVDVPMDDSQLKFRQYQLARRDKKAPEAVVTDFQLKKGIVLSNAQRRSLLSGQKVSMNSDQVQQASVWGNTPNPSPAQIDRLKVKHKIEVCSPTSFTSRSDMRKNIASRYDKIFVMPELPEWTLKWIF